MQMGPGALDELTRLSTSVNSSSRMSLEKAIRHGKERRKQFRGSRSFDSTCRNHGSCSWCAAGRKHSSRRREPAPDVIDRIEAEIQAASKEHLVALKQQFDAAGIGRGVPPWHPCCYL